MPFIQAIQLSVSFRVRIKLQVQVFCECDCERVLKLILKAQDENVMDIYYFCFLHFIYLFIYNMHSYCSGLM